MLKLKAIDEVCSIDQFHPQEVSSRIRNVSQPTLQLNIPPVSRYNFLKIFRLICIIRCILNLSPRGQEIESKIWYFGEVSKATAENWLSNASIGTFLFRVGSQQKYVLSLR